jgi:hypothetical protein
MSACCVIRTSTTRLAKRTKIGSATFANFKPDSNKVGKICDNFRVVFQEVQVVLLGSRFVRPSLSILLLGELVPSTIGKERPISAIEIRNCM